MHALLVAGEMGQAAMNVLPVAGEVVQEALNVLLVAGEVVQVGCSDTNFCWWQGCADIRHKVRCGSL